MAEPTLAMSPPMSGAAQGRVIDRESDGAERYQADDRADCDPAALKSASGDVGCPAVPSWPCAAFPMNSVRPTITVTPASSAARRALQPRPVPYQSDNVLALVTGAVSMAMPQPSARARHRLSGLSIRFCAHAGPLSCVVP